MLNAAAYSRTDTLSYPDLVDRPAIRDWIEREFERGLAALDLFEETLPHLSQRRGAATLGLLGRAIRRYAERYAGA